MDWSSFGQSALSKLAASPTPAVAQSDAVKSLARLSSAAKPRTPTWIYAAGIGGALVGVIGLVVALRSRGRK